MKDLITYCPDLDALRKELIDFEQVNEEGDPVLTVIKTPVQHSKDGNKSLSLVRCLTPETETNLGKLKSLEILGTYDEVFADSAKMAKYTSVYSIEPVTLANDNGEEVIYQPPKKFGVFA